MRERGKVGGGERDEQEMSNYSVKLDQGLPLVFCYYDLVGFVHFPMQ